MIGVIAAMSLEFNLIKGLLSDVKEEQAGPFTFLIGNIGHKQLVLMQCGIGKVNAAMGATFLINRYAPSCVISTGVAGGIDTCLHVMDVVVSESIVYHDVWCGEGNAYGQVQGLPEQFKGNAMLVKKALSLPTECHIKAGLICSGDKFITEKSELQTIKDAFPEGLAVEMESGAIAQVCHRLQTPFVSFRVISDTPGVEEHWAQYSNFWETVAHTSFNMIRLFLQSV